MAVAQHAGAKLFTVTLNVGIPRIVLLSAGEIAATKTPGWS